MDLYETAFERLMRMVRNELRQVGRPVPTVEVRWNDHGQTYRLIEDPITGHPTFEQVPTQEEGD